MLRTVRQCGARHTHEEHKWRNGFNPEDEIFFCHGYLAPAPKYVNVQTDSGIYIPGQSIELRKCLKCGSMVLDSKLHTKWHDELEEAI